MKIVCLKFRIEENLTHHRLFIGHPGVAKSILINCLEEKVFLKKRIPDEIIFKDTFKRNRITYVEISVVD